MLKSDGELSANNATIPAHMSAPPEKTHKPQTTPLTSLPNIIPTYRDTPNRSSRHSMHLHARQRLTRGQTNVPRISGLHVLRWKAKKETGCQTTKECHDWPQVKEMQPLKRIQS
ncbi:hypothetical protein TcCL_Unassigned04513 [Trypanosoma cruzi]|nr:hypothetical protein TcCL_Unassigned04513 [Trypanosoma cruzi]